MSDDVEVVELAAPALVELAYETPDPLDGAEIVAVSDAPLPAGSGVPIGPAGGVLSGRYPNPGFAIDMATQAELTSTVDARVATHRWDDTPHPVYDDLPSLTIIFENGLV